MKAPLPTVEGVGPSSIRLPAGRWATVLDFLSERFPGVGVAEWESRMRGGRVVDERGLRLRPESPYRAGACVFYYRELEAETTIPFDEFVLYEDEHLLVVDKPHFLPVTPAGRFLRETLLVRLRQRAGREDLAPVHRLDRETAGVVLFSRDPSTRGAYVRLFRERRVEKVYEALAGAAPRGLTFPHVRRSRIVPGEPFFRMREAEGEPNSETRIDLLAETHAATTLYRLKPTTGKKHQLRLHLSALGMPIINDRLYPFAHPVEADDFSRPLKLLAKSVSFRDPVTGRERRFESVRTL